MDANFFPLLLVIAVAFTGAIYLLEVVWLAGRREAVDPERPRPVVVEYSISFFPVILIVLVLRSFLIEPFQIPSGSMIPTLEVGDFIVVNKFAYGIRLPVIGTKVVDIGEPRNGDVMVFIPPHENEYFIKRVIGVPGDTVTYDEDKVLSINGSPVELEFIARVPPQNPRYLVFRETLGESVHYIHQDAYRGRAPGQWTVPEGHYFMMGDNRDRSADSRIWGLVSEKNIIGKAFAIWVHKEPGFSLPSFKRNGLIP